MSKKINVRTVLWAFMKIKLLRHVTCQSIRLRRFLTD